MTVKLFSKILPSIYVIQRNLNNAVIRYKINFYVFVWRFLTPWINTDFLFNTRVSQLSKLYKKYIFYRIAVFVTFSALVIISSLFKLAFFIYCSHEAPTIWSYKLQGFLTISKHSWFDWSFLLLALFHIDVVLGL